MNQNNHGGFRPGAGRKPSGRDDIKKVIAVSLAPEDIERARELGHGNISAGIRRALAEYHLAVYKQTGEGE